MATVIFSGSYKQIYQNKLRRQQNAAAKSTNYESGDAPFSVQGEICSGVVFMLNHMIMT